MFGLLAAFIKVGFLWQKRFVDCVIYDVIRCRLGFSPLLSVAALPGIQRSVWMIQNGDVIGQEKYFALPVTPDVVSYAECTF